jgi:sterol desaturase/sphingolipid hydroxylase (fatty acid hydroxylase superfamily)
VGRSRTRLLRWPLLVGLGLGGLAVAVDLGVGPRLWLVVPVALTGLLLVLEQARPRDGRANARWGRELWQDLGHNLLGSVGNPLGQMLFVGLAVLAADGIRSASDSSPWPEQWPRALQILLLVFLADGLEYFRHRLAHRVEVFWSLHAIHHSLSHLNVLKAGRAHLADFTLRGIFVFAPLVAVGAPAADLWWYLAALALVAPMAHANLDLPVPSCFHYVLLTPALHRLHHASATELCQKNFANVFPLWDVLFGTFRHPAASPDPELGIEDDPFPPDFLGQLAAPLHWKRLRRVRAA